jgi:hypothetical protein
MFRVSISALLGDCLCGLPAVQYLSTVHEEVEVHIADGPWPILKLVSQLVNIPGVSWTNEVPKEGFDLTLWAKDVYSLSGRGKVGGLKHFEDMYLYLAGYRGDASRYYPNIRSEEVVDEVDLLLAPYSWSVKDNNKNYSPREWGRFVDSFPERKFLITGGNNDSHPWAQSNVTYALGRPLEEVVGLARKAKLVVTTDNGVGHLMRLALIPNHVHLVVDFVGARVISPRALRTVSYQKNDCTNLVSVVREVLGR